MTYRTAFYVLVVATVVAMVAGILVALTYSSSPDSDYRGRIVTKHPSLGVTCYVLVTSRGNARGISCVS